ncbi:TonB-dependent siderophore receptor [Pacificimonas flava]|uniref:TonB-dependent siderophore receptor n=3 Tax=Pacificimonas TaxID=1960290 RepID=A0A219B3X8_9SPHN|nr:MULTISPECIES: TonB-dependent siderophore receptor [Pacificimonas]MBZ6377815.1 TonB-dependent siderophore receptor [Pacificimonas aurantium]OWV32519.1 TonB-dependent siderophore receptor [Pacificimonas flava]
MMAFRMPMLLACTAMAATSVQAADTAASEADSQPATAPVLLAMAATDTVSDEQIVVTAARRSAEGATKTDTPLIEVPQPITVITDDEFLSQGALSISDTVRYAAGVVANPYGPDSRVDGGFIRGVTPLQFRDGMRDIFSYYVSIRADPYNFDQVEIIRGPASVLFGAGALGGIINLVSKTPEFETSGEVALRYGTYDRKEALADVTGTIAGDVAGRLAVRVRDSDTRVDYVGDDRVMVAPSVTWQPTDRTEVTLIGLYQEDDTGSTSQFPPLVGTLLPNPNGELPEDLFVGKPGWDRYDGRLLQGTGMLRHEFNDTLRLNLKARYIDSDITYFTHYADSYSNPLNPYLDEEQRTIGLYASGSIGSMDIFSTDNNLQVDFATGSEIEHRLLAGVDYRWNRVRQTQGYGYEFIDIYDIDYDSLLDYDGGIPQPASSSDTSQKQLGFYLQDQIRIWDRVSVVLGVRHDDVTTSQPGTADVDADATSFRAGIIGEVVDGVSPFFSYTESFEPISGTLFAGGPAYEPKQGRQFEAGVKIHPDPTTLITATAFHIKETNRAISDDSTADPNDRIQAGEATSKGFELEARKSFAGDFSLIAAYSYNEAYLSETDAANAPLIGKQLDNVPKHLASLWGSKAFDLGNAMSLRLGAGGRYVGEAKSFGPAFPNGLETPDYFLVDALAELSWERWSFAVNSTNLLGEDFYASCLARGDCFLGEARQVFGTLKYEF